MKKHIPVYFKGVTQYLVYLLLVNIIIKVKQKPKHIINNYVQVFVLCYISKHVSTVAALGPGVNYLYFAFAK